MKRVAPIARRIPVVFFGVVVCVFLSSTPADAQSLDLESLTGDSWYGLYMNGDKVGYAKSIFALEDDGEVVITQEASFKLTMVGVRQSMRTVTERRYAADGSLLRVESLIEDISGTNTFVGTVVGDSLVLVSGVGGAAQETILARPRESLSDSLSMIEFVRRRPEVGERVTFRQFEPMFQMEIEAVCELIGVEIQNFEGVLTTIYRLKTTLDAMGIDSVALLTEEGVLLEDRIAGGLIVMRLEPEAIAKDITFQNDTIVSNAAMVDAPIANPRTRASLRLRLEGPLTSEHRMQDAGQSFQTDGDGYIFEGRRASTEGLHPTRLPVSNDAVREWIEPSIFVQSDDPRLIAKAQEIVGDETDARKVSEMLVHWVYKNVRPTFSARLTNSLDVLENLEGDCTEHSMLFIGLARAAGLPAREVAGLIYVDSPRPGFYFHQWAKVWMGEWIDVDPTFNQPLADATHIKLAEGDLMQQIKLLPVIGQLEIEVLED